MRLSVNLHYIPQALINVLDLGQASYRAFRCTLLNTLVLILTVTLRQGD